MNDNLHEYRSEKPVDRRQIAALKSIMADKGVDFESASKHLRRPDEYTVMLDVTKIPEEQSVRIVSSIRGLLGGIGLREIDRALPSDDSVERTISEDRTPYEPKN